jgi:hypothetical protein
MFIAKTFLNPSFYTKYMYTSNKILNEILFSWIFFLNYYSSDIMKTFIATFETLLAEPENQVNNEKKKY